MRALMSVGRPLSVATAVLLLGACGGNSAGTGGAAKGMGGQDGAKPQAQITTPTAAKKWAAFDPPSGFKSPDTPSLPDDAIAERLTLGGVVAAPPAVLLQEGVGFVGGRTSIQAVDLDSGKVLGKVAAKNPTATHPNQMSLDTVAVAPIAAQIDGHDLVLSAVASTVPGQGTTGAVGVAELLEMDATTHTAAGDIQISLGTWASDAYGFYHDDGNASVVGVAGTTAILQVSDRDHSETVAVDLVAKKALWQHEDMTVLHVDHQQLLVAAKKDAANNELAAVDLATGAKKWEKDRYSEVSAATIGPNLVLMNAFDSVRGKHVTAVVNAADGSETEASTHSLQGFASCRYDDKSVTICTDGDPTSASSGDVSAFDSDTGKVLWQLPDTAKNRVAPLVTAVWHGRVYGTVDGKPVMLDAVTGADIPGAPNIAPLVVDGYFGLALDADKKYLVAYHASA